MSVTQLAFCPSKHSLFMANCIYHIDKAYDLCHSLNLRMRNRQMMLVYAAYAGHKCYICKVLVITCCFTLLLYVAIPHFPYYGSSVTLHVICIDQSYLILYHVCNIHLPQSRRWHSLVIPYSLLWYLVIMLSSRKWVLNFIFFLHVSHFVVLVF